LGVRAPRVVSYPGAFLSDTESVLLANFKEDFDEYLDGLTRPIEAAGEEEEVDPGAIVFTGNFDEVNGFFADAMWSDRKPVIPPTIERIEEFLKYTDYDPFEEIGLIPAAGQPALGSKGIEGTTLRATPWNIAANGVMAGCKPEFMPVLIAFAKAMADPWGRLTSIVSTIGIIPYTFVNGPIARQLDIVSSQAGMVARGANPALARALGLLLKNLSGFEPGISTMASFGYPTLGIVWAEDEEACVELGWEPYHVAPPRRPNLVEGKLEWTEVPGFDRNANAVTSGSTMNWGKTSNQPYSDLPEEMGMYLAHHMISETQMEGPAFEWKEIRGQLLVLITKAAASTFANAGWSRQDLRDFLWKNGTWTKDFISHSVKWWNQGGVDKTVEECIFDFKARYESLGMEPPSWVDDEHIPAYPWPEKITIVVCGDRGRDRRMPVGCWYTNAATTEIELPANWDELMEEAGYPPLESFYL
jgi:hypothetical protein